MKRYYCPNKELAEGRDGEKGSKLSKLACGLLGDRIDFMIYRHPSVAPEGEYYIADAIKGGNGVLGLRIAIVLACYIPICKYPHFGRNIVCNDITSHSELPLGIIERSGEWWIQAEFVTTPTRILQDDRYLVAIQDGNHEVYVYLYKKSLE